MTYQVLDKYLSETLRFEGSAVEFFKQEPEQALKLHVDLESKLTKIRDHVEHVVYVNSCLQDALESNKVACGKLECEIVAQKQEWIIQSRELQHGFAERMQEWAERKQEWENRLSEIQHGIAERTREWAERKQEWENHSSQVERGLNERILEWKARASSAMNTTATTSP